MKTDVEDKILKIGQRKTKKLESRLGVISKSPNKSREQNSETQKRVNLSDPVSFLVINACKKPLLTREEELTYARQYKRWVDRDITEPSDIKEYIKAKNAKNMLIERNIRFVLHQAHERVRKYNLNMLSDFVSEGILGLFKAVENFDPERGFRFATYAKFWVNASMIQYVHENLRATKLNSKQKKLFGKWSKLQKQISEAGDDQDSLDAIAKECNYLDYASLKQEMFFLSTPDVYLEEKVSDWEENLYVSKKDNLVSDKADPETIVVLNDLLNHLNEGFDKFLSDQVPGTIRYDICKTIITERILNDEPKTLEVLGADLHLSRERIRQYETEIKNKISKYVLNKMR